MELDFISLTAGDPWTAPDGWDTLHPQLNLNLDDQTPYVLHGGAMHVATEVSRQDDWIWIQRITLL